MTPFIEKLLTDGVAHVTPEGELPAADDATTSLLAAWEQAARAELSADPPPFVPAAAVWAAGIIYQACRCVSCRDVPEEELVRALRLPCPALRGPDADWSVDLILRQLPPLYQVAKHLSNGDPLVRELMQLSLRWPLSSVGVPLADSPDLASFIEHPALRDLYVDRILEKADVTRLGDARVDAALRAALGGHPELCPVIAQKLCLSGLDPLPQSDEVAPG